MANEVVDGALYIVATPIGNLSDISARALEILRSVDFVAAEDTRVTAKLFSRFEIKKPLFPYHEHNMKSAGAAIIEKILAGGSCALVCDAGSPAISDPGEDLVRLAAEADIEVFAVPGPCAAVCALSLSGLSTRRFAFEGFLPPKTTERKKALSELKGEKRTMVFYEAPHRLVRTLEDMLEILSERRISLCRELTKINEQVIRTTLSQALRLYDEKEPRGEYVLVLEGAPDEENPFIALTVREHYERLITLGFERSAAMKEIAKTRGISKSEVYKELLG